MFKKITNFIKYHNAFTIGFMLIFVGFNVSLAASEDFRDNFVSSQNSQSIDNSYVLTVDLDNLNFDLQIKEINEDAEKYYIVYNYKTVAIADYVWQDVIVEKTLTVSRVALNGKDLGLYVAEELSEHINYELSYLKEAQVLEKEKGLSQKIATTQYAGLVGKFLSPKEKVFPDYEPVVTEPEPEVTVEQPESPEVVEEIDTPVPPVEQQTIEQPAQQSNQEPIDRELIRQIVQEILDQAALDGVQTGESQTTPPNDDPVAPSAGDDPVLPDTDDPVTPEDDGPICDVNNLTLCNESNCGTDAGGYYYGGGCHVEEKPEEPGETATNTPPVITLAQAAITLTVGDTFDPADHTVTTDPDGDTVTQYADSSVDTTVAGTYSVEYTAEDEYGMWAVSKTLSVIVKAPAEPTCDTENLDLCDENNCSTDAGGYWYSGACNSTCQEFTFYLDADGDTFGNINNPISACEVPDNHVGNSDDCDDSNANINPNATEVCGNDIDENCDGVDDECSDPLE